MDDITADVQYEVIITATITEEGGYWRETALQKFADDVNLRHYKVFISTGAGEPKEVRATIKLGRVLVTPRKA